MPVQIERIESGIYWVQVSGTIVIDELIAAQQQGNRDAEQHGDDAHVLIIDIDRSTQMPFDIRKAGQIVENNAAKAVITVGASLHIKLVASILGRLFSRVGHVEHQDRLDSAVTRARKLLAVT
jgi:hypothetical protein